MVLLNMMLPLLDVSLLQRASVKLSLIQVLFSTSLRYRWSRLRIHVSRWYLNLARLHRPLRQVIRFLSSQQPE